MTTEKLLSALRRRLLWIICCALAGTLLATALIAVLPRTYAATARVVVDAAGQTAENPTAESELKQRMPTVLELVRTHRFSTSAADALEAAEIEERLSYSVPVDTTVITVTATADTVSGARELASTEADDIATGLSRGGTGLEGLRATQLDSPVAQAGARSPDPRILLPAGALAGLLIGVLTALALAAWDTRARRSEDIEELTGTPVLAALTARRPGGLKVGTGRSPAQVYAHLGLVSSCQAALRLLVLVPVDADTDAAAAAADLVQSARASGIGTVLVAEDTGRALPAADVLLPAVPPGALRTTDRLAADLTASCGNADFAVLLCTDVRMSATTRSALEIADQTLLVTRPQPRRADLLTAAGLCAVAGSTPAGLLIVDEAPGASAAVIGQELHHTHPTETGRRTAATERSMS